MKAFNLEYIANRRKELKLTLNDMAKKLNMSSEAQYFKYERGIYRFRADMIPKLANALGCPIEKFFA